MRGNLDGVFVRSANIHVAFAVVDQDAGICGDVFWGHIDIERIVISYIDDSGRQFLSADVDENDDSQKGEHPEHEKNFAGSDAAATEPAAQGTLVEFYNSPENDEQRPPAGEEGVQFQAAEIVQQQKRANRNQNYARKKAAAARLGGGHWQLASLRRDGGRGVRGRRNRRRHGWPKRRWRRRLHMAFARGHGGSQLDYAHDNQNDWPSVVEIEGAVVRAIEEKENAYGDQNRGPHQAADGAALAVTMNAVAHVNPRSRSKTFFRG